tara:strand:- start:26580 stop:26912 length:333 start_codon:yes stop_codon:yes gene_type:complete
MIGLNSIHFAPYEYGLDFAALVLFSFGSFMVISILLFYYSKIPKSNAPKDELETPIYQSTDILLQSSSADANYLVTGKTTSTWVKGFVFVLFFLVVVTPLYQLLGVEYFI